jgi:hypothetical protein
LVVAVLMGFVSISSANYLRMIGPAPLRFEPAPEPIPNAGEFPRLAPDETPASPLEVSSTNPLPSKASPPIAKPEAIVMTVKSPGLGETNEVANELMPWMSTEQTEVIGPQVFLPYFRRSVGETNIDPERIFSPPVFIPPTRLQRSSSKATYATP